MNKWLKQNITIAVILTLLMGYGVGAAFAAVLKSDVEILKSDVSKLKEQVNSLPADISSIKATLNATNEDIRFIKNYMVKP